MKYPILFIIFTAEKEFTLTMIEKRYLLAEKLRTYISRYGINDFNEEHLKKVGLSIEELKENFSDRQDMVGEPYLSMNGSALKKSSMNIILKVGMQSILC